VELSDARGIGICDDGEPEGHEYLLFIFFFKGFIFFIKKKNFFFCHFPFTLMQLDPIDDLNLEQANDENASNHRNSLGCRLLPKSLKQSCL
jgi:hypothetical protein